MQYVNDDMDDVFKKAGEEYPLQSGTPNWDKVQHALDAQVVREIATPKNGRKKYLWLLLLLPFAVICNRYMQSSRHEGGAPTVAAKEQAAAAAPAQESFEKTGTTKSAATFEKNETADAITNTFKPATKTPADALFEKNNVEITKSNGVQTRAKSLNKTHQQRNAKARLQEQLVARSNNDEYLKEAHFNTDTTAAGRTVAAASLMILSRQNTLQQLQAGFPLDSVSSALAKDATLHCKPRLLKSTLHYKKGFYAGVMGSADLTSVRLQKPSGLGWHYGLLAGYQWNARWSIEAGAFADRKYYYTKGKYFDTTHLYLPPNTEVSEVTGACTMLEFPLAVKYNLSLGDRSAWFVTAGISSYVMKEEDYTYTYHYRNSGNYSMHDKTYRNASTNLFSVLQLSGGYARHMGRSTALRLEPYLKLPLAGLGYGKLHLNSAGLNVGLIKKFR